jgi:hypothetical protein
VRDVRDDARVGELGQEARLAREALRRLRARALRVDQLQRHAVTRIPIARAEHGAHPAAAGLPLDLEAVREQRAWLERGHGVYAGW